VAPHKAYTPASIPDNPLSEMNLDDRSIMDRMEARSFSYSGISLIAKYFVLQS
jgi:hypothetical protein